MGKKKGPTPMRPWMNMVEVPVRDMPSAALEEIRLVLDDSNYTPNRPHELWGSDRYTCSVWYLNENIGREGPVELCIHNHKRTAIHDWRHFQQIKNDILGEEREACELYPAESRLLDEANEYHLFAMPVGEQIPFGQHERNITDIVSPFDNLTTRQRPGSDRTKGTA